MQQGRVAWQARGDVQRQRLVVGVNRVVSVIDHGQSMGRLGLVEEATRSAGAGDLLG
jgi:hypothetical protein